MSESKFKAVSGRTPLNWIVVNPDAKLLAILDSESEAYWFTKNRGHAQGAVYFKAPMDYAQAPELLEACKAACQAASDCLPPSGEGELDALYYKAKLLAIDEAAAKCSAAIAKCE